MNEIYSLLQYLQDEIGGGVKVLVEVIDPNTLEFRFDWPDDFHVRHKVNVLGIFGEKEKFETERMIHGAKRLHERNTMSSGQRS